MKYDEATGKPIIELSHSGLATFNSCPKKFAFRKVVTQFNEERVEYDSAAVGSALHEGIQYFMVHRNVQGAIEAMLKRHPIELYDTSKASEYSVEASIITLLEVIENSELPDYELAYFKKGDLIVPATEVAFLVIIETAHTIFHVRGFIDLVLKSKFDSSFFAVDIKTTTKTKLSTFEARYKWDWQITSYGIPLNALLGDQEKFRTGIFGVIQSDREPQTIFPNYPRTKHDVEAYQFYLLDSCRRIEYYLNMDQFPRGPNACIGFNRPCEFIDKCSATTINQMQLLVNPSGKEGAPPRPFDPVFIARFEA